MRKKTVMHVADTIFWYALYFLPVIMGVISIIGFMSSESFFTYWIGDGDYSNLPVLAAFRNVIDGFGVMADGPVYMVLYDLFSTDGLIPVFSDDLIFKFFSYFINVYLIHLCVDFVLFIPRLAHKWMKKFTQGDE